MPIVALDWQKIKERLGGSTAIYALTDRQASLLLGISEQLTWDATYRTAGYDFADKDALDKEIADLQRGLMMPVYVTDLIEAIEAVRLAIDSQNGLMQCCESDAVDATNGEAFTDTVIEDSLNGVPQELVDAGIATDVDDWESFQEYQCAMAHVIVNNMQSKVVQFEDMFDHASVLLAAFTAVSAVLATIFSGGSLLLIGMVAGVSTAAGIYTWLSTEGEDALPTPEEIQLSRQALVCAWVDPAHDGFDDRFNALRAAIDSEFNFIEAELLKLVTDRGIIKGLYNGKWGERNLAQEMVDANLVHDSYVCEGCAEVPSEEITLETAVLSDCSFDAGANNDKFTVNSITEYVDGWQINLNHLNSSNHLCWVTVECQPSIYAGTPGVTFTGLNFVAVRHDDASRTHDIWPQGDLILSVANQAGHGVTNAYFGLHTEPDAGYQAALEAIMGQAFHHYSGSDGMDQMPTVVRNQVLQFTVGGVQEVNLYVPRIQYGVHYLEP